MSDNTRRENVIAGFRALADFLEKYPDAPMPEFGRIDVTTCVLAEDQHTARTRFGDMKKALYYAALVEYAEYTGDWREHEGTQQHEVNLEFGNGAVAYQVLWIEKTGEDNNNG
jgi:hypothetical protein